MQPKATRSKYIAKQVLSGLLNGNIRLKISLHQSVCHYLSGRILCGRERVFFHYSGDFEKMLSRCPQATDAVLPAARLALTSSAKSTGFSLSGIGSIPFNENFSLFGKLCFAMITGSPGGTYTGND
jgi:hypothetical protein